jgi:predicted porin
VELKTGAAGPAAATIGGTAPIPANPAMTWHGITLYGTLDVGVGYMTHGEPLSTSFGPGLNYLVSKDSNRARWGIAPNALGYSSLGLKGREVIIPGLTFVFDAQTTYLPTSGRLSNGLASLASNNGVPLNRQSANADSSRAGQIFNSFAFVGLSTRLGTLTYGRQNSFDLDGVIAYDPLFASNAFSVIGWQGATPGSGDTENARLDSVLKYTVNVGPVRTGVLFQLPDAPGKGGKDEHGGGGTVQVDIGTTFKNFSADAIFSHVDDAIAAGSLTAAQLRTAPPNSLAATVSDNTSVMLLAKYRIGKLQLFAGYENIRFANPGNPVVAGTYDYRYQLAFVNNTAYTQNRLLQVVWTGARYAVTKKLSLDTAYYHEHQNSYSATRCTNASLGSCSGNLDAVSLVADYKLFRQFEVYGGAMLSSVSDGLASGFLNRSNVDPTVGGRFTF